MQKSEFKIEKPKYERYKESFSDRIFHDGKNYMVKRTFTVKGYDNLLRIWNTVQVRTEILPLSILEYPPVKSLELTIVLLREATDFQSLKLLKAYFKQTFKISVKDAESNIFIKLVDGKVFMSDLIRGTCCPMQRNHVYQNITTEKIGEATRISEQEAKELMAKGHLLYEEILPSGELRQIV
jgi:hypothetical protein